MSIMDGDLTGVGNSVWDIVSTLSSFMVIAFVVAIIGVMIYFVGWKLGAYKTTVYIFEKIGSNAFVIRKDKQGRIGKKYQKTLKLLKANQEIVDFSEDEAKVFTPKGVQARLLRKFGDEFFPMVLKDNPADSELEIHTLPADLVSFRTQKIIEFANRYKTDDWRKKLLDIAIPITFGVMILVFMIMYKEEVVASLKMLQQAINLAGEITKQTAYQISLPPPG